MHPMLSVSRLSVVSECPWRYLRALLCAAINVEHLTTGSSTEVDDAGMAEVMAAGGGNRLARLKTIKVGTCNANDVENNSNCSSNYI